MRQIWRLLICVPCDKNQNSRGLLYGRTVYSVKNKDNCISGITIFVKCTCVFLFSKYFKVWANSNFSKLTLDIRYINPTIFR